MARKMKWLWTISAILVAVGGAVHLAQGFFGTDLLSYFGTWAPWVQGIAGLATLIYVWKNWK